MSISRAVRNRIGIRIKASSDLTHLEKKWQFSCSSPAFPQLASEWGCLRLLSWKRFRPQRDSWNIEYSSQWYAYFPICSTADKKKCQISVTCQGRRMESMKAQAVPHHCHLPPQFLHFLLHVQEFQPGQSLLWEEANRKSETVNRYKL